MCWFCLSRGDWKLSRWLFLQKYCVQTSPLRLLFRFIIESQHFSEILSQITTSLKGWIAWHLFTSNSAILPGQFSPASLLRFRLALHLRHLYLDLQFKWVTMSNAHTHLHDMAILIRYRWHQHRLQSLLILHQKNRCEESVLFRLGIFVKEQVEIGIVYCKYKYKIKNQIWSINLII